MDFVTRRSARYRELVRIGVTTTRLAQSRYKNGQWFVEVKYADFTTKAAALEALSWYLRTEFDGQRISVMAAKPGTYRTFVVGFYSEAL